MNFRDINALMAQRQRAFLDVSALAGETVYGNVSTLWKDMFASRSNFLSAENFNFFRHPSSAAVIGVGSQKDRNETTVLEEQVVPTVVDAHDIPDDVIAKIAEPLVGSPPVEPYRGNLFSSVFLHNVPPVWRVVQAVKQFGPTGRPLRVCEIGAGFGAGALLLHQLLDIESYTIIDLPENLYMSSIFLPTALGRSHNLVDPRDRETLKCGAQLNFTLPSFTDALDVRPFDLVWNRASMGEMPGGTAAAYIAWIKTHLAPDGIFHFANRFNVPRTNGAMRLSDFGLQHFDIRAITPMVRFARPTNQIHSEIVAMPARGSGNIRPDYLDVIGDLTACGFDPQTVAFREAAVSGNLPADVTSAFDVLAAIFNTSSLQHKYDLLQNPQSQSLGDIKPVLLTILELLGGAEGPALVRKDEVLSLNLGYKLEIRLRGLYAEIEAKKLLPWRQTLQPFASQSAQHTRMAEILVEQSNPAFSTRFMRDLRVAS